MGVLGVDRQTWQDLLPQEEQSLAITLPLQCSFPPAPCPALTYIVKAPSLALAWETPGFWKEQAMTPPVTEGFPPTPPPISL